MRATEEKLQQIAPFQSNQETILLAFIKTIINIQKKPCFQPKILMQPHKKIEEITFPTLIKMIKNIIVIVKKSRRKVSYDLTTSNDST